MAGIMTTGKTVQGSSDRGDKIMDRKEFLRTAVAAGAACCGAASGLFGRGMRDGGQEHGTQAWIGYLERKMIRASETPAWHKADKGQQWIKSLMDHMDAYLDDETRKTLMQACGRSCYIGAFGVAPSEKPTPEEVERFIKNFESQGYTVEREAGKTTVVYSWGRSHQNPWGLIMSDGYCMCPLVEKGPDGLSPTFCLCSTGYVKEIFARSTGKKVNVELIDSLKQGGQDCIFRINILEEQIPL